MRHIDNIEIHGFSGSINVMNIGANKQFKNQRANNLEYDKFLNELQELLKDDASLNNFYNTLIYKGSVFDIVKKIMPKINLYYNEGLTPKDTYNKIKEKADLKNK